MSAVGPPAGVLDSGRLLGDYEIQGVAGAGGMGVVYKARQRSLDRSVALKLIRQEIASMPEYRERFLREARLAASVNHPNVVAVHDLGEVDEFLFLVMQWIDGQDLSRELERNGRLHPDRAVVIATELARALDAVHGVGLVHRDVKPANVLLRQVGNTEHAYLTDFGIAKPSEPGSKVTQTGWIVGTSAYMSPEQIRGEEPGRTSDLYALACVFYEMITGQQPFTRNNDMAVRWAHANDPRPRVSTTAPELGARYDQFLSVALSVDPGGRFRSGEEFAAMLAAVHAGRAGAGELSQRLAVPRTPTTVDPPTPVGPALLPPQPSRSDLYAYESHPAVKPPGSRSGNPLVLILLALMALAGIGVGVLAATGLLSAQAPASGPSASSDARTLASGRRNHSGTASNSSTGKSRAPAAGKAPSTSATSTYDGNAFSISYPVGWYVADAEQNRGSYTDTTIISPSASDTLLRVDFSQTPPNSDPTVGAQPEINSLRSQPGYRQLELQSGTFQGHPALRWKFDVLESGVLLEKEDMFFTTRSGLGFGVLTQAPASEYARLAPTFAKLIPTLVVK